MTSTATLNASIASLILTITPPLDDAGILRDDWYGVRVWVSTVNGFTPSDANLHTISKSLTIVIGNLTPLTTYYVRWAFVSSIDVTDYVISSQLSAVPNKIDGTLIADTLKGKAINGSIIASSGTILSSSFVSPAACTVATSFTLNVVDSTEFSSTGGCALIVPLEQSYSYTKPFRVWYTGKTATTLTGVNGIDGADVNLSAGSAVIPIPYPATQVVWPNLSISQIGTSDIGCAFKVNGGNGLAFGQNYNADAFTYTKNYYLTTPTIDGISGLSGSAGKEAYVVHDPGFPTISFTTTPALTWNIATGSTSLFSTSGGELILIKVGSAGYWRVPYKSANASSITFFSAQAAPSGGAASWIAIPVYSGFAVGGVGKYFEFSTFGDLLVNNQETKMKQLVVSSKEENGIPLIVSSNGVASILTEPFGETVPLLLTTIPVDIDITAMPVGYWGFSIYAYQGWASYHLGMIDDTGSVEFMQKWGGTHYFSGQAATAGTEDTITFNDTSNVYSLNADGGAGNAYLQLAGFGVGDSVPNAASVLVSSKTKTAASASSNAIYYSATYDDSSPMTANRVHRAFYGLHSMQAPIDEAFDYNLIGGTFYTYIDSTGGYSLNGQGTVQGIQGLAANNSDHATAYRCENAYGVYARADSYGNTSLIDQAYGLYAWVRSGGTDPGTPTIAITTAYGIYVNVSPQVANRNITTAYMLYLDAPTENGVITNKWGIYQANAWKNHFTGNSEFLQSVALKPSVLLPTAGSTMTLTTDQSSVYLRNTATLATTTIALPTSGMQDGQEIEIVGNGAITALTVTGTPAGGNAPRGMPTTLAANGFFKVRYYDNVNVKCWARCG